MTKNKKKIRLVETNTAPTLTTSRPQVFVNQKTKITYRTVRK